VRDVTANFEVQKPAWRPWLPEQPTMSQVSLVKAERARQNRAYVRGLLTRRQPGFAAALASAEQHLSCQGAGLSRPLACSLCNTPLYGAVGAAWLPPETRAPHCALMPVTPVPRQALMVSADIGEGHTARPPAYWCRRCRLAAAVRHPDYTV
jgi:hypothetical protein